MRCVSTSKDGCGVDVCAFAANTAATAKAETATRKAGLHRRFDKATICRVWQKSRFWVFVFTNLGIASCSCATEVAMLAEYRRISYMLTEGGRLFPPQVDACR